MDAVCEVRRVFVEDVVVKGFVMADFGGFMECFKVWGFLVADFAQLGRSSPE